jgi:hypothetical protein
VPALIFFASLADVAKRGRWGDLSAVVADVTGRRRKSALREIFFIFLRSFAGIFDPRDRLLELLQLLGLLELLLLPFDFGPFEGYRWRFCQ